jgi:hypothetical protein
MKGLKNTKLVKRDELNPHQKLFAYYYTLNGDTLSNAVMSYAMAYGYKLPCDINGRIDVKSSEYQVCQVSGSRLLMIPKIITAVEKIMLDKLNNSSVDAHLSTILHYGKDTDSLNAIKIYNDLNNRIVKNLNLNVSARPFQSMSDEDLEKLAEQ